MRSYQRLAPLALFALACLSGCVDNGGSDNAPPQFPAPEPPSRAPRALHDRFWVLDDQPLTIDLLANDEVNGATLTELPAANQAHGTLTVSPDGKLTYTPGPETTATDTFTYTLANAKGSSTATVTVNRSGKVYVDSRVAPGGDGSSSHPFFNLLTALQAAQGRPTTFVINDGLGNGQGLGDAFFLSPGQAVVGQDSKNPAYFTGTIHLADNTLLQDLSFGDSSADGSVVGNSCQGVVLQNLQLADNGSFANAIQLNLCGQVNVSGVKFNSLPTDVLVLTNPLGETVINGVSLTHVGGGIAVKALQDWLDLSQLPPSVDLNNVECSDSLRMFTLTATNQTKLRLTSTGCRLHQADGQSMVVADVNQQAYVDARLQNWVGDPIKLAPGQASATVQLMNWDTRDFANTTLRIEGCNMLTPAFFVQDPQPNGHNEFPPISNPLLFSTHGQALGAIVLYKTALNYAATVNVTAHDQSAAFVRMQDYGLSNGWTDPIRKAYSVFLNGSENAKMFARFYTVRSTLDHLFDRTFTGIYPQFQFNDSSKLTIVNLFGFTNLSARGVALWRVDNDTSEGDMPVVNGVGLTPDPGFVPDPANFPNYSSVSSAEEDGLGIPLP